MNNKPNILFVMRDPGGCGFFRCQQPAAFLGRAGLANATAILQDPTKEQLLDSDLVIIQNTGSVESANMVSFMIQNRIPFMTEFDDFVQHVSPKNLAGYSAWNPGTLFVYRAMEASRKAVGMTVSTPQLAREYFPYNSNIYVIPNFLDKDKWDHPQVKRADGKIRIGWCGGNAHADDLKMIAPVLDKIVKEYKGKVIFETMGMLREELVDVFPMKLYGDNCPSCGYEGEMHHFPGESLDNYPMVLASRGWDIAVAPVIDNSFGNCKSDLKVKEYAAVGYATVASPVVPYKEACESGAEIILAKTFDEWYNAIKWLIENPEKRNEMARKNKDWIQKYWIGDNIEGIFGAYKEVIDASERMLGTKASRLKKNGV